MVGYAPPNLAISTLYWKAWLMLLMLIAHNPGSLGSEAWNSFPTLRALMEMCITNDFTTSSGSTDQTELQMAAIEKQTILEFETHLAAASTKTVITENNSLLLSQVIIPLLYIHYSLLDFLILMSNLVDVTRSTRSHSSPTSGGH